MLSARGRTRSPSSSQLRLERAHIDMHLALSVVSCHEVERVTLPREKNTAVELLSSVSVFSVLKTCKLHAFVYMKKVKREKSRK